MTLEIKEKYVNVEKVFQVISKTSLDVGYLHNNKWYEEDTFTTEKTISQKVRCFDLATNNFYVYKNGKWSAETNLDEVLDYIAEIEGSVIKVKGFISEETPTGTPKKGYVWYQSDSSEAPTTFPIQAKKYDGSAWSGSTISYTPADFDGLINENSNKLFYYIGGNPERFDIPQYTLNYNSTNDSIELKDENNVVISSVSLSTKANLSSLNVNGTNLSNSTQTIIKAPVDYGTAGQVLKTNSTANGLEWGTLNGDNKTIGKDTYDNFKTLIKVAYNSTAKSVELQDNDSTKLSEITQANVVAIVQDELDGKVDKVSTINKLYGTDASGNQTTYDKDDITDLPTINDKLSFNKGEIIRSNTNICMSLSDGNTNKDPTNTQFWVLLNNYTALSAGGFVGSDGNSTYDVRNFPRGKYQLHPNIETTEYNKYLTDSGLTDYYNTFFFIEVEAWSQTHSIGEGNKYIKCYTTALGGLCYSCYNNGGTKTDWRCENFFSGYINYVVPQLESDYYPKKVNNSAEFNTLLQSLASGGVGNAIKFKMMKSWNQSEFTNPVIVPKGIYAVCDRAYAGSNDIDTTSWYPIKSDGTFRYRPSTTNSWCGSFVMMSK